MGYMDYLTSFKVTLRTEIIYQPPWCPCRMNLASALARPIRALSHLLCKVKHGMSVFASGSLLRLSMNSSLCLESIQVGHDVALLSYLIVSLALGVAREEPGELLGDDVGLGLQSGT